MNIKQTSERLGVPASTLRYWEEHGLIPPVPRDESGYRDYSEHEVKWILFIKAMRKGGLSVAALEKLVKNYRQNAGNRDKQRAIIQRQYDEMVEQRQQLDHSLKYLKYKLAHFDDHIASFLAEEQHYQAGKSADDN